MTSIYGSILPSGGKLLCQLFEDIFGVEVVWIVVVDGFEGRGGGLTRDLPGASALEGRPGQERPVPELKACKL